MNKIVKSILAIVILLIYIPVFLIALVFAMIGFDKMKKWCNNELDFWDKEHEKES